MPMSQEKEKRLRYLNEQCQKCIDLKRSNFLPVNPQECAKCHIGIEVHCLDGEEWDKVDWNHSRYESYYGY